MNDVDNQIGDAGMRREAVTVAVDAGVDRQPSEWRDVIRTDLATLNNWLTTVKNVCIGAINATVVVGNRLKEVKREVGHGNFQRWISENLPELRFRTASRYMKFASNWPAVSDKSEAKTLRQAYIAAGVISTATRPVRASATAGQAVEKVAGIAASLRRRLARIEVGAAFTSDQADELRGLSREIEVLLKAVSASPSSARR